jgi:hypothetical protein
MAQPPDKSADPGATPPAIPQLNQAAAKKTDVQKLEDRIQGAELWMIRLTAAIAFFALCGVIVSVLQWCAMRGQLTEMRRGGVDTHTLALAAKDQADLMRKQLVGTMSAVLAIQDPQITTDPITTRDIVILRLSNGGHVIAPEAQINFKLNITSFPEKTTVYQSNSYTIVAPQVGPGGWSSQYPLPNFSAQDHQFSTQKRTVTVEGTFGFDNGFGDKFEQDFCFSYVGKYNTKNEDGGSTSGGGGFFPCGRFKEVVDYVSKWQLK